MRPRPVPIVVVRILTAVQLAALAVCAVAAGVYLHKTSVARGDTEDGQFAEIGYGLACALALLGMVLLVAGLVRLGTAPRRGRLALILAQCVIFYGANATAQSLRNPHGPDPVAGTLLAWFGLSTVVALILMLLPQARAWWKDPAGVLCQG